MTREEVKKILFDKGGKPFEEDGETWQMVLASLPDGYRGIEKGYSFLQSCRSLQTNKISNVVFYLYINENGKYNSMNSPLHENVIAKFEIDWDAGTAKVKDKYLDEYQKRYANP